MKEPPPTSVYTLTDEDRKYLTDLEAVLWPLDPSQDKVRRIKLTAHRQLERAELSRVFEIVERHNLLTSMFTTSMFGGVGMDILEHEPAPDVGPTHLLRLIEGHLPDMPGEAPRLPGGSRDAAWEAFSKFTHSARNARWLKSYKMEAPQRRSSYEY